LPYALQLAHGWTRLSLYVNLVSVIVLVPLIFVMTKQFGAIGAAIVWVILNTGYVLVDIQLMHRRLLPGDKLRWYCQDVGLPMVSAVLIAGLGRLLMPDFLSQPLLVFYIALVSLFTLCITAWVTPATREWVRHRLFRREVNCDT
jgi:O-antigen/teichoic acid export membrane protein